MGKLTKWFDKLTLREHYREQYRKEFNKTLRAVIDATSYVYPPIVVKAEKGAKLKSIDAAGPVFLWGEGLTLQTMNIGGSPKKRVKKAAKQPTPKENNEVDTP